MTGRDWQKNPIPSSAASAASGSQPPDNLLMQYEKPLQSLSLHHGTRSYQQSRMRTRAQDGMCHSAEIGRSPHYPDSRRRRSGGETAKLCVYCSAAVIVELLRTSDSAPNSRLLDKFLMTGVANNGSQRISTTSLVHKLLVQIVKNNPKSYPQY